MISFKMFTKKANFKELIEFDRFSYVAYYLLKNGQIEFNINEVDKLLKDNGYYISNLSRIRSKVKNSKYFKKVGINKDKYILTQFAIGKLEFLDEFLQNDEISELEVNDGILDFSKFLGHTTYLNKLVLQANKCYDEKCYDACATMLRRILEILLIKSYENLNISQSITDSNGNYYMLEKICDNAKSNQILKLSRIKSKLDLIRNIGNYASHRITYNTTKKDIDDLKLDLRALLEELLYKAGFLK